MPLGDVYCAHPLCRQHMVHENCIDSCSWTLDTLFCQMPNTIQAFLDTRNKGLSNNMYKSLHVRAGNEAVYTTVAAFSRVGTSEAVFCRPSAAIKAVVLWKVT